MRSAAPASLVAFPIAMLASALLSGCSSDSTGPGDAPSLSVSPAAAPPGAPVRIIISDPGAVPSGATITIGGFPAALKEVSEGEWVSAVPLFLTESGQALPDGPVDVVALNGATVVAEGARVLTVTPPPAAPGASQRALERLTALSAALEAAVDEMAGEPGRDAQYLYAATRTVTELVNGSGPNSLRTAITSLESDPEALTLLDSWFEASGVLHVIDQQATLVAAIAAGAPPSSTAALRARRTAAPTVLTDVELARRMQLYEVAKLFGETVVAPTAVAYGNIVGLGTGVIGLTGTVGNPVTVTANVISAILAVTDFMINKVAVGLLPARIDSFTLEVTEALLEPGDVTDAQLRIVASNAPPPIGVQDMVGLILAGLGSIPTPQAASIRESLMGVASFALSTMQSFISQYASANPGANLDTEIISVPAMEWEAVVTDPRLVERLSHTPETITGLPEEVNWQASTENSGEGRIYSRTMVGPSLLSLPPGVEYNGGAFGDNILATEPVTVMVQHGGLVLDTEFPATIAVGASVELRVRAGHGSTGETEWGPGIQLTLTAEGGTVGSTTGTTDADGYFAAMAQLNEGSTEITVVIEATDGAAIVTRTVTATTTPARHVELLRVHVTATSGASSHEWTACSQSDSDPLSYESPPIPANGSASATVTLACTYTTANGQSSGSFAVTVDEATGWVRSISGTGTGTLDLATLDGFQGAVPQASGSSSVSLELVIRPYTSVNVRGTLSCTTQSQGGGSAAVRLNFRMARASPAECPTYVISDYLPPNPDGHYILSLFGSAAVNLYEAPAEGRGTYQFSFEVEFY